MGTGSSFDISAAGSAGETQQLTCKNAFHDVVMTQERRASRLLRADPSVPGCAGGP